MVPGRFIGEEVKVRAGDFGRPLGFAWRGMDFEVVEILSSWRKLDLRRAWWRCRRLPGRSVVPSQLSRRHRDIQKLDFDFKL